MTRWALVRLNEAGFACEIRDSEARAAALLAVARTCDPFNFSSTVAQRDEAYDALRAVMPEFDEE